MSARLVTELEIELAAEQQRLKIEEELQHRLFERTKAALAAGGFFCADDGGCLPQSVRGDDPIEFIDQGLTAAHVSKVEFPSLRAEANDFAQGVSETSESHKLAIAGSTPAPATNLASSKSASALDPATTKRSLSKTADTVQNSDCTSLLFIDRPARGFLKRSMKNRRAHRLAFYLSISPQFRRIG